MVTKEILKDLKIEESTLLNEINSSDLVLFGDDHNMNSGRVWLKNLLPKLSKNFQNLGLEYLPFPSDKYIDNGNLLESSLKENYKDFPGFDPNSVLEIIDQANNNGVEVFGIDMPLDTFSDWTNSENQKERTKFMAKVVLDHLEKGNTFALFGADHVEFKDDNVYGLVKKEKPEAKILSIIFIGGKTWTIDTEDYWIRKLELLAKESGRQKTLFILKNSGNEFPCDFVIHFPQVETR